MFDRSKLKGVEVHGFNVTDGGERSIGRAGDRLEQLGYQIERDEADYGYFNFFMIRFGKWSEYRKTLYRRLQGAFATADFIITHSNGANFATQALYGMPRREKKLLLINFSAALDRDTEIPHAVDMQVNYCTPYDWIVKVSALIPFYEWGSMGAHGYCGRGPNVNLIYDGTINSPKVKGHSAWFREPAIDPVIESLDTQIQLHLGESA